jgi:hypothetical protein
MTHKTKTLPLLIGLLMVYTTPFAQKTNFNINGYPFISDTSFYNYGVVIRCARYSKTAEEIPAALCCHYAEQPQPTQDNYYYTGSNWTCPPLKNARGTTEHGILSQNCSIEIPQLQSLSSYAHQQLTLSQMVDFCQQMKPSRIH